MKQFRLFLGGLLVLVAMPFMLACSNSDNDIEVKNPIDTYIIGLWQSYQMTVVYGEESMTQLLDKNNDAQVYIELNFENNNKATICGWALGADGLPHWAEEPATYTINGNIVTIKGDGDSPEDLFYDQDTKTLAMKLEQKAGELLVTATIYYKKVLP